MLTLPHDSSVCLDDDMLADFVTDFSLQLRLHPRLRRVLVIAIGNRWADFEDQFAACLTDILLRRPHRDEGLAALGSVLPGLSSQDIADARDVFTESALAMFPFHMAAAIAGQIDLIWG
jgi:hypothetical protein